MADGDLASTSLMKDGSASTLYIPEGMNVGVLELQDDCQKLDPWTWTETPSAAKHYNVWSEQVLAEVAKDLSRVLREHASRPEVILIIDHHISSYNFGYGPEMEIARDLLIRAGRLSTGGQPLSYMPLQILCEELVANAELALISMSIGMRSLLGPTGTLSSLQELKAPIEDPLIWEAKLVPSKQRPAQPLCMLSELIEADLELGALDMSSWLDKLFFRASKLKTLRLGLPKIWVPSRPMASVVPQLTFLHVQAARLTAVALRTMLASSHHSLQDLILRGVTLFGESTWADVLLETAGLCTALKHFHLRTLRDHDGGADPLDWVNVEKDVVPESCRAGLELPQKGPPDRKRVIEVEYSGPHASEVLETVGPLGRSLRG